MTALVDEPRIGELFAGYGGLGMGVKNALGAGRVVWVSDIDPGSCKVLAHRFPDVPNLGDITAIDWSSVEPVEVLTAGFPCQDVSNAGKQAGLKEGTRSGLWHMTARAIASLRPPLVVLENVRGLLSARGDDPVEAHVRALDTRDAANRLLTWIDNQHARAVAQGRTEDARRIAARRARTVGVRKRAVARARWHERRLVRAIGTVLGSLADIGYDAVWHGLRASDVGACHGRFRIFIVAWPADAEGDTRRLLDRDGGAAAHDRRIVGDAGRTDGPGATECAAAVGGAGRPSLLPTPRATDGEKGGPNQRGSSGDLMLPSAVALLGTPTARDGKGVGAPGSDAHAWALEHGNVEAQVLALLPTPAVNDIGEGKTVEWWDEWAPRQKSAAGEPAPHGKSLAIEAQRLLPTPVAKHGGRNSTAGRSPDAKPHADGDTLADLVFDGRLMPTPRAAHWARTSDRAREQYSSGDSLADALLPTPSGLGGGQTSRGGDRVGEPLLGGIAQAAAEGRLLPTPMVGSSSPAAHGQVSGQWREQMAEALARWGDYAPAITRWEYLIGRPAPAPTMLSAKGNPQLAPPFTEWMMGLPEGWISDVPDVTRNEALKLCGNGVVPQQAEYVVRGLLRVLLAVLPEAA